MTSTGEKETLFPTYEVHVDGSKIPPEVHVEIYQMEVDLDIYSVGMFTIMVSAGERDLEKYKLIDSDHFRPGNEIKIKMGYGEPLDTMIVGEITSLAPEYSGTGAIGLHVQGYDRLYHLGIGRKTRSFQSMKDSEIASQIAEDWSLTPDTAPTDITHEYVMQNNKTDREFITQLARRNRFMVRVEDKTLIFKMPAEDAGKTVTLTYNLDLIEFYPRLSTIRQNSKTTVRGWNPKEKKELKGEAGVGDETTKMEGDKTGGETVRSINEENAFVINAENVSTKEEAEGIARNHFNAMAMQYVTGEGCCIGNTGIKAGEVVELKELGERFSGHYYITSCRHVLNEQGYLTYFKVRRSAI